MFGNDFGSCLLRKNLARSHPYNDKVDNCLNLKGIKNCVFVALNYDDHDKQKNNGVLQVYNKTTGYILREDLERLFYLRKLVGSASMRCEIIMLSLQ